MRCGLCLLLMILAGVVAAEEPPPVPDPIGLGERLALIDHLREQGETVEAGRSLEELRAQYQDWWQRSRPTHTDERAIAEDQRRRLRRVIMQRYAIDIAEDVSMEELVAIRQRYERADERAIERLVAEDAARPRPRPQPQPEAPPQEIPPGDEDAQNGKAELFRQEMVFRYPSKHTDRMNSIPDLFQTLRELGHEGGGYTHCAPTAISNALMWLAGQGHPELALDRPGQKRAHYELARLLSGPEYMNTSPRTGTHGDMIIRGLRRFLADRQCTGELLLQGMAAETPAPTTLDFAKGTFQGKSAVWLVLGYYHENEPGDLRRYAGHIITMCGYGVDRQGRRDPAILVANDSADGIRREKVYLRCRPLEETHIRHDQHRLPITGWLEITEGLHVPYERQRTVIEWIISLRME